MTKKELLEAIKDMPEDMEIWVHANALYYEADRVEPKTLWTGKVKQTVITIHGYPHIKLC